MSAVAIRELLALELSAHGAVEGENLTQRGPELPISARQAQALSMAFHELATNAVKHGALSVDNGRIDVSWRKPRFPVLKTSFTFGGAKQASASKPSRNGGVLAPTSSKRPYHVSYTEVSTEHFIAMASNA
jgi:two-component sensor histidine kinase